MPSHVYFIFEFLIRLSTYLWQNWLTMCIVVLIRPFHIKKIKEINGKGTDPDTLGKKLNSAWLKQINYTNDFVKTSLQNLTIKNSVHSVKTVFSVHRLRTVPKKKKCPPATERFLQEHTPQMSRSLPTPPRVLPHSGSLCWRDFCRCCVAGSWWGAVSKHHFG